MALSPSPTGQWSPARSGQITIISRGIRLPGLALLGSRSGVGFTAHRGAPLPDRLLCSEALILSATWQMRSLLPTEYHQKLLNNKCHLVALTPIEEEIA